MKHRILGILCGLMAVGTWSGAALAQDDGDRNHDGFFFRMGFNVGPLLGSATTEFGGAETEADYSGLTLGYDLMFGGTPVDGLVIGGALIAATTGDPTVETDAGSTTLDGTLILGGAALFGNYYFDPSQGFHVQALLGFAAVDAVSDSGTSGGSDPTGFLFGVGAGYDFFFANEWSVGPFGRLVIAPTSVEESGATFSFTHIYPSIGATITLH